MNKKIRNNAKTKIILITIAIFLLLPCAYLITFFWQHIHNFTNEWKINEEYHWHQCDACDETNAKVEHSFDREIVEDEYLKSVANCTSPAIYYKSCICGAKGTVTFESGTIDEHAHSYGESINYEWSSDYSTCTATRVCNNDSNHTETEMALAVSMVEQPQSCQHEELSRITVTFNNSAFEPQRVENIITQGISDHAYIEENVDESYFKEAANCEHGKIYFKSCSYCGIASDTITFEVGAPLGHDFENGEFMSDGIHHWKICDRCGVEDLENKSAHTYTQEIVNESYLKEAANCEHGTIYYKSCICGAKGTETFENGTIDEHAHSYGESINYEWSSYYSTCTATRICLHNSSHIEEETAYSYSNVTQHQDCESVELTTYTATFTNPAFTTQEVQNIQTADVLGHDFVDAHVDYEWADDYSYCDATMHCTRHYEHTESERSCSIDSYVTTEKTCKYDELSTITAYFSSLAFGTPTEYNVKTADKDDHLFTDYTTYAHNCLSDADCENPTLYYACCEYCGMVSDTITFEVGTPLGHDFENGEFMSDGTHHWKICNTCGDYSGMFSHEYTQEIVNESYLSELANCQHGTLYFKSCECGKAGTETFEFGELGDHIFTRQEPISTYGVALTNCEHGRLYYYRCENCSVNNDQIYEVGEGLGHSYGEWIIDGDEHYHVCTREECGHEERDMHSYNQNVETIEHLKSQEDCENRAVYYISCICGANGTETFESGEPLGHQFNSGWEFDETHHWHTAICEHTDLKDDYGEHSLDGDGICLICGGSQDEAIFKLFANANKYPTFDENYTAEMSYMETHYTTVGGEDECDYNYDERNKLSYNNETGDIFYTKQISENWSEYNYEVVDYLLFRDGEKIARYKNDAIEADSCMLIQSEELEDFYNGMLNYIDLTYMLGLDTATSLSEFLEENPDLNVEIFETDDDILIRVTGSISNEEVEYVLNFEACSYAGRMYRFCYELTTTVVVENERSVTYVLADCQYSFESFDSSNFENVITQFPPTEII